MRREPEQEVAAAAFEIQVSEEHYKANLASSRWEEIPVVYVCSPCAFLACP